MRDFTYAALHEETNRFASLLTQLGVAKGDRVFSLLGRVPELYFAAFGALKNGCVFSPLFSAFGPEPIKARMSIGRAKVPKGAVHVHEAVVAHHITGRLALDLRSEDTFWCTADPGWVTGTSYGIISPLTNGATLIFDQAEFETERWYRILQDLKVTVWY